MITGKQEELADIVKTHVCPEHPDKALTVAWLKDQGYAIRCGGDHYPAEVTRQETLTQMFKRGEELPPTIKASVEKGIQKRAASKLPQMAGRGLDLMPKEDLGTGAALNAEMIVALYNYARQYGLDAYRGHVMLMYGKPYIGIDGYLYHANKQQVPYQLRSRPLDEGERKAMQLTELDHSWKAEIIKPIGNEYFVGIGIVTQDEMTATSKKDKTKLAAPVVAAHPWQLAQKRAEWQALRRAFPIGEAEELKEE